MSPKGKRLIKRSHLTLSTPSVLLFLYICPIVSLCVNSHLLQEEASWCELSKALIYWWYVIKSHFIAVFPMQNNSTSFSLGPSPIYSSILEYSRSIRYGPYLVEWALSPTLKSGGLLQWHLCHYCSSISHRQIIVVVFRVCRWVILIITFFLWVP